MHTMYTAQVVDLQQVQGEALDRLLREGAERAASGQYWCEVLRETERRVRDFWAVPGDLAGRQVVVSCWEVRRLPPVPRDRVLAWRRSPAIIGSHKLPA